MDMSVDCKPAEAFNQVPFYDAALLLVIYLHMRIIFSVFRNGIGSIWILEVPIVLEKKS